MGGEREPEPIEEWAASPAGPEASRGASSFVVSPVPVVRRGRGLLVAGAVCALVVGVAAIAVLAGPPVGSPSASPAATSVARIPASPAHAAASTAGIPSSIAPSASPAAPAAPSPAAPSPAAKPALAAASAGSAKSFPNEDEAAILAALPGALARTCSRGGTSSDARLAGFVGPLANAAGTNPPLFAPGHSLGGVTCHPVTGAARLYVMAPGSFAPAPGEAYLGYLTTPHDVPRGSCATDRRAYERWFGTHGTGLLACMNTYGGRPWIYFSFSSGRYLAFATRDDANYRALYAWWEQLMAFLP